MRAVLVLGAAMLAGAVADDPGQSASPGAVASPDLALAADTSQFRAGNIISDNLFYDGNSMNASEVQDFLNVKGANCVNGVMPCLKNFRQDTSSRAPDARCAGYQGAPGETAAWIIFKVGQSCGISQRTLMVMLQKEQRLLTASGSSLTARRYQIAMGYGCPDTAACDTLYYGFANQLYSAARQFKNYAANPGKYGHRAGMWNNVRWSTDAGCGTGAVFIENNATAGLYNYTPYQPNGASLAARYGTGDRCSEYGNRNFWLFYTDWFGSTQSAGGNAIVARATAPATANMLGAPVTSVICGIRDGGCFQGFQGAAIYWSPASGAQVVLGDIYKRWASMGWENSRLGYPTSGEICVLAKGGCLQTFQHGSMYWTLGTGAQAVLGAVKDKWSATRWELGPLGYPIANEVCGLVDGGCLQKFEGGSIYWSGSSGARAVYPGPVLEAWKAGRWETGPLGYPVSDTVCGLTDSGCAQHFQGGSVYHSATAGTHTVSGAVLATWGTVRRELGPLGYPTGDTTCGLPDDGCSSDFQGGSIYSSKSTGAHILSGDVLDSWVARSAERSALGYPTTDTFCGLPSGGCFAHFQNGSLYWTSGTGARAVTGAIRTRWEAAKWETGPLGYPAAEQICGLARGGCFQKFQTGFVYTAPASGTRIVSGAVFTAWAKEGWEVGRLGYPTKELFCGLAGGACFQQFEGGAIYSTPGSGTYTVLGAIGQAWGASGWELGPLGYPTGNEVCAPGGQQCSQSFQRGAVHWSTVTGARFVNGALKAGYDATGGTAGPLGYPTRNAVCGLARSGCFQDFQNGSLYWTPTTGAHAVSGAIRTAWGAAGWELGTLGYPTQGAVTTASQITQRFEGGTLTQNRSTGKVTRR
jgi:uncharacterized protein with LGFP repeats